MMKTDRKYQIILVLLLISVNLALFLPSMRGGFIWDDPFFVSENPNLVSANFIKSFMTSPFGGFSGRDKNSVSLDRAIQYYRPFTSLSYWLDLKIWGLNPAAFHLTNIVLHTANCFILYLILVGLGIGAKISSISALLFSAYPLHFENVAWISGRTDLLSFLFAALSALFFVKYWRRRGYLLILISSIWYFFSLLSKENAVLLIGVYALIAYAHELKLGQVAKIIAPFALSLIIWLFLRTLTLGAIPAGATGATLGDLFSIIGFYFVRMIFPFFLSVTIDVSAVFGSTVYIVLGCLLCGMFLASAAALIRHKTTSNRSAFLFFSFFLFLLPPAVIIFLPSTISLVAWRFMYLNSALFLTIVTFVMFEKIRPRRLALGLLTVLFVLYSIELYPKNRLFGNDEMGFWLGIEAIEREDLLAKYNIGAITLEKDEKKALAILETVFEGEKQPLHKLWELKTLEKIAEHYTMKRDFRNAEVYFKRLFTRAEGLTQHGYFIYAYFLGLSGKIKEGERIVLDMLRTYPENHLVLKSSAKFYILIEDYERAILLAKQDYDLFPLEKTCGLIEALGKMPKKKVAATE